MQRQCTTSEWRARLGGGRGSSAIVSVCGSRAVGLVPHLAAVNELGGGSLGLPAAEVCLLVGALPMPGMLRCMPYLSGPQKAQPEVCRSLVPTNSL